MKSYVAIKLNSFCFVTKHILYYFNGCLQERTQGSALGYGEDNGYA